MLPVIEIVEVAVNGIISAGENGEISEKRINESVKRCTLDLTDEDNQVALYNVLTGDADILISCNSPMEGCKVMKLYIETFLDNVYSIWFKL